MPRYFFHVHDGEQFTDLHGTVLDDVAAAKKEASRFAADLFKDRSERFWDESEWVMQVADEDGRVVAELRFSGVSVARPADE